MPKKKLTKSRRLSKSKLKKKLWIQVRTYIKNRDGYICQLCGKPVENSDAHCSHILPKGEFPRYEFEEWNLKTLCYRCHLGFWHKNPLMATLKFKTKFPRRYSNAIDKAQNYTAKPLTTKDLMQLYQKYLAENI